MQIQHKNKEKALSLLASKLKQAEIESQQESIASERKNIIGTETEVKKLEHITFHKAERLIIGLLTQHNLIKLWMEILNLFVMHYYRESVSNAIST